MGHASTCDPHRELEHGRAASRQARGVEIRPQHTRCRRASCAGGSCPERARAAYREGGIAGRDHKARPWGSAVVAFNDALSLKAVTEAEGWWPGRPLGVSPIGAVTCGHLAIATVEVCGSPVTLASAYGLVEFAYASGSLLRILADLEPLLDDPDLGRNRILAGDWNMGTWWSGNDLRYAAREGAILNLLERYGMTNCLDRSVPAGRGPLKGCPCPQGDDCRDIETYRRPGQSTAYMDDYLFATKELAE
jgi:hypothetical protein